MRNLKNTVSPSKRQGKPTNTVVKNQPNAACTPILSAKQISGEVEVYVEIPKSIIAEFQAFYVECWEKEVKYQLSKIKPNVRPDPRKVGFHNLYVQSLEIGTHEKGNDRWDVPFNQPTMKGIPSKKGLLEDARKKCRLCEMTALILYIDYDLLRRIKRYAAHRGIQPIEHIMCCFNYHAALWRRDNRPNALSSFSSFDKKLGREFAQQGRGAHE